MTEFFENFWWNLKRTYVDVAVLLGILATIFFLPAPETGLIALAIGKLMFVSAGILHAHITRKIIWTYIDFNLEQDVVKKVMIVAWYVVIIWSWARGG